MSATPPDNEPPLRVFVAIHVPADIQWRIASAVGGVRNRIPEKSIRWVRVENIHLTLRFLGNVSCQDIEALKTAVQRAAQCFKPFALQLSKAGCFPDGHAPRVLWMGLAGEVERLRHLQLQVTQGTRIWGRAEQRDFHPHLTLGRVTTKRRGDLARITTATHAVSVPQCAPWQIDAVYLMRSVLAPGGSRYSTLASFPLIG